MSEYITEWGFLCDGRSRGLEHTSSEWQEACSSLSAHSRPYLWIITRSVPCVGI